MGVTFSKIYRLQITPFPQVQIAGKEDWMMDSTVTEEYLIEYGLKKHTAQVDAGSKNPVNPKYYLNKRRRYLKYVTYKKELKAETLKQSYFLRTHDFWIKYYLPMPKSWSASKKKKLNFEPHLPRPDLKNLNAAFEDALFEEDSVIYDYRSSKFWIDLTFGFIDIEIGTLPPCNGYTQIIRKSDVLE